MRCSLSHSSSVYTVTRVILVPQGEFVSLRGAVARRNVAGGQGGRERASICSSLPARQSRCSTCGRSFLRSGLGRADDLFGAGTCSRPCLVAAAALGGPRHAPMIFCYSLAVTLALVTLMGPMLYRLAFQPLGERPRYSCC